MMEYDEGREFTQRRLADETGTMAELLGNFRPQIPTSLVGERELKAICDRLGNLPATFAAFPFGFELPLNDSRPAADFGLSLAGGTPIAAFFQHQVEPAQADADSRHINNLLAETDHESSRLREIVGRKLMLEYDVASAANGRREVPGIFMRPYERPMIAGCRESAEDVGTVVRALVSAVDWEPDSAERRNVENVFLALQDDTRLESIGAFPARERSIRLAAMKFRSFTQILDFLERIGWPGDISVLADSISQFEAIGGFKSLGVHLDVRRSGVGPVLGLGFYNNHRLADDPKYWLDDPNDWDAFLEALTGTGVALPEKLAALAGWPAEPTPIFGRAGPYMLLRGIHHIKVVVSEGRLTRGKAYVFMLLNGAMFA